MNHKYPVGTWVRFYHNNELFIAVVEYLPKREPWDRYPQYHTNIRTIGENEILEARLP